MNISLRGTIVVVSAATLAALTGCGSPDNAAAPAKSSSGQAASTTNAVSTPAASPTSSSTPASGSSTAAAGPTTDGVQAPTVRVTAACGPASDRYLTAVTGAFKDRTTTLMNAFVVAGPGDLQYIGAQIVAGGKAVGATGVWVAKGATVYALSDEARSRTSLADGSAVGAGAGDEFGRKVQDCVAAGLPELGLGTKGR